MTHLPPDYDPRMSLKQKNRGSDLWYMIYYLPNGTRLNKSTRTSRKMLASSIAKQKEQDLLAGKFTDEELRLLGSSFGQPELSIRNAVERYFAITGASKSDKTLESEKPAFNKYFVGYFYDVCGAKLLRDVTPAMVNDLVHQQYKDRPQSTRHFVRRSVSKVFQALIREGSFEGENPVARSQPVPMTKKQRQRDLWIPHEHFVLLLDAAKQSRSPLPFRDMFELNWEVALRTDEILTLEWWQIELDQRLLHIVEKPDFPTEFGRGWKPKWGNERHLPLTDSAITVLKRQPKRLTAGTIGKTDELAPTNLVFPKRTLWKGKVRYLRANQFKRAFHSIVNAAGLELYGYVWHDMRRSWNRLAAERGIPVAYRAAFLGHREEVNESSYETDMSVAFMRERMGQSMTPRAGEFSSAVRDLFELPVSHKKGRRQAP
ncbi:tyrosine-type recombinase/integrase [Myxococcota bacterium]